MHYMKLMLMYDLKVVMVIIFVSVDMPWTLTTHNQREYPHNTIITSLMYSTVKVAGQ